jgi:hypothetical protein
MFESFSQTVTKPTFYEENFTMEFGAYGLR